MKRIILSLSLLLTVTAMTASAGTEPAVNEKVKQSFKKEFAEAKFVEWKDAGDYVSATFVLWDLRAVAYFTPDGQFQGCTRTLFYNQLPLAAIKVLDKKLTNADILEVVEISNPEGTYYKLTVEENEKRYEVKVDTAGNITESPIEKE